MNKSAANSPRTRNKSAANTAKKRDDSPINKQIPNESATNPRRIRYAFAPILQQFRAHTKKNEARLWIPIETSLLSRYDFASCSPQTRYVFVAILLYCGANGIDEIPLDAKFMSSVLIADFRTVENSFVELLSKNLLQEREEKKEKKEQTDRQDAPDAPAVCVEFENLSQEITEEKTENKNGLLKIVPSSDSATNLKHSQFTIEECLKYVELCQSKGDKIANARALATNLFKSGDSDSFIRAALYPQKQSEIDRETFGEPTKFTDQPCAACFGAKMADADGKGYRKCERCKNERGASTGLEPEGVSNE